MYQSFTHFFNFKMCSILSQLSTEKSKPALSGVNSLSLVIIFFIFHLINKS
ncbi:MAG: hypothetical protein LBQ24_02530 [Candidatus Peribacteria bacterium]|nr:hypothetical protein [Candidatus Peribacteria bacterium]